MNVVEGYTVAAFGLAYQSNLPNITPNNNKTKVVIYHVVCPDSKVWIPLTRWLPWLLPRCTMWTTQAAPTASCATQEASWPSSTMTRLCSRATTQHWPSRSPQEMISATSSKTLKGGGFTTRGIGHCLLTPRLFVAQWKITQNIVPSETITVNLMQKYAATSQKKPKIPVRLNQGIQTINQIRGYWLLSQSSRMNFHI